MDEFYATTEIEAWENNTLAILNAIETLKGRLADAPEGVLNDVRQRCDPETHAELLDWIGSRESAAKRWQRLPAEWSPKQNKRIWILYAAADLKRPAHPPI